MLTKSKTKDPRYPKSINHEIVVNLRGNTHPLNKDTYTYDLSSTKVI